MRNTAVLVVVSPLLAAACASLVGFPDVPNPEDGGSDGGGSGSSSGGTGSASGSGSGSSSASGPGEAGTGSGGDLDGGAEAGSDARTTGPATDAGSNCNLGGTWATKLSIPVNWVPEGVNGVILAEGTGTIEEWIKSDRVQSGATTVDTAVLCGITLPDLIGTSFVGGETYGVRFPDSLFDSGNLPSFAIGGTLSDSSPSATFSTNPWAAMIGLTLANPTTTPWPSTVTTAVDVDKDDNPGVTVNMATGSIPGKDSGLYSQFPVDTFLDRANQLFIVLREVMQGSAFVTDCDHIGGTATILKIPDTSSGKYAFDSHVIGCNLVAGGQCSQSQTTFVDDTQPVFSPTGSAASNSVRINGATCAAVRQALP